jgi:hypothetical protein
MRYNRGMPSLRLLAILHLSAGLTPLRGGAEVPVPPPAFWDSRQQEPQNSVEGVEQLREYWTPLSLDLRGMEAQEALEKVFAQSGERLEVASPPAPKKISLQVNGATFWDAVDRICKAHANLRYGLRASDGGSGLVPEPWIPTPTFLLGPLRFSIYDVVRTRESRFPGRFDRTDVTVVLQWLSKLPLDIDPKGHAGRVKVLRATDEQGNSMLPTVETNGEFELAFDQSNRKCGWALHLQLAPRSSRISRLDLEWQGNVLTGIEEVRIENPPVEVGRRWKVGNVTLMLERFAKDVFPPGEPRYDCAFFLSWDPSAAPPEWRSGLEKVPLSRRILPDLRHEGGMSGSLTWGSDGAASSKLRGFMRGDPAPFSVRVAKDICPLSIRVTFENIPLP